MNPCAPDVRALLERHVAFASEHSPPEDVHVLDVNERLQDDVTFVSFRLDGQLLGVGAVKMLDGSHAELKSMHTAEAARGRASVGRSSSTCWPEPALAECAA